MSQTKLTVSDNDLMEQYLNGSTIAVLALRYQCGRTTIRKRLIRHPLWGSDAALAAQTINRNRGVRTRRPSYVKLCDDWSDLEATQ